MNKLRMLRAIWAKRNRLARSGARAQSYVRYSSKRYNKDIANVRRQVGNNAFRNAFSPGSIEKELFPITGSLYNRLLQNPLRAFSKRSALRGKAQAQAGLTHRTDRLRKHAALVNKLERRQTIGLGAATGAAAGVTGFGLSRWRRNRKKGRR